MDNFFFYHDLNLVYETSKLIIILLVYIFFILKKDSYR